MSTHWSSPAPHKCDTCGAGIDDVFYDGKTGFGPWACMCPSCFTLGPGLNRLGTGFGQKYEKQADGKWLKTGG
jgi:hypothetical protein